MAGWRKHMMKRRLMEDLDWRALADDRIQLLDVRRLQGDTAEGPVDSPLDQVIAVARYAMYPDLPANGSGFADQAGSLRGPMFAPRIRCRVVQPEEFAPLRMRIHRLDREPA